MPRHTGCKNTSDYKYEVQTLVDDIWVKKMYVSQKEIVAQTGLKRSAVYYLTSDPSKIKNRPNIKITKLKEPLPVFTREIEENDMEKIIKIKKNFYT